MSDPEQPLLPPETVPEAVPPAEPPLPPAPPRTPFWGYNDLLLFMGLTPICIGLGFVVERVFLWIFRLHPSVRVEQLLPGQLLGYIFLFGALGLIFRAWYGRPFWRSLGWTALRMPVVIVIAAGIITALGVVVASALIHLPETTNPMTELMESRTAILLMAIFGVTAAPLCEELAFRGFLQPLLVRSLGAIPGILLASIPFGLLHFQEYGNSWRHALLISAAGAAFGWMRHVSGSTKASALMHASYNALFFLAIFSDRKDWPQTW